MTEPDLDKLLADKITLIGDRMETIMSEYERKTFTIAALRALLYEVGKFIEANVKVDRSYIDPIDIEGRDRLLRRIERATKHHKENTNERNND
jgi:hypothetical protein